MKVRFLGTGTSTGVPELGCTCEVCTSKDVHDNRLRSSVRVEVDDTSILIDCTPDARQQLLNLPFKRIDALLVTHEHFDHVGGIEDLRSFGRFGTIDIYVESNVENALRMRMPYCFTNKHYAGIPDIELNHIDNSSPFYINNIKVIPIRVMHHKLPILGFRIGDFAYLTDVKTVPQEEMSKLKDLDLLVISALRHTEHISHQTLEEAIYLSQSLKPDRTIFTHMSHHIGLHKDVNANLPVNCELAYDGMEIELLQ